MQKISLAQKREWVPPSVPAEIYRRSITILLQLTQSNFFSYIIIGKKNHTTTTSNTTTTTPIPHRAPLLHLKQLRKLILSINPY
jgi:hypothetical protein